MIPTVPRDWLRAWRAAWTGSSYPSRVVPLGRGFPPAPWRPSRQGRRRPLRRRLYRFRPKARKTFRRHPRGAAHCRFGRGSPDLGKKSRLHDLVLQGRRDRDRANDQPDADGCEGAHALQVGMAGPGDQCGGPAIHAVRIRRHSEIRLKIGTRSAQRVMPFHDIIRRLHRLA